MGNLISGIEFLGLPTTIAIALVGLFLLLQVVGELLEFKGKAVPEFVKIRKYFKRKKDEKEDVANAIKQIKQLMEDNQKLTEKKNETNQTLEDVKQLLSEVNCHYSADNIAKRDAWMCWVNARAETYDNFIKEIGEKFEGVTKALDENTKMTEEMFVENSRDRIIDFAEKVTDPHYIVSHEQFRRIFRVYNDYESWLENHNRTNGEVDMNYDIIKDAYAYRVNNHSFAEDLSRYKQ